MLTTLAVSAIAAAAQKNSADKAIEAQNAADNANVAEQYRVTQEQQRQAASKAFEERTDRARAAARATAMARVGAAEGAGSLSANAVNITAAAAEDMSRIQASLDNTNASARQQMAALQTGAQSQANVLNAQAHVNSVQFGASLGKAAVGAGTSYFSQQSSLNTAKGYVPDSKRPSPSLTDPIS